MVLSFSILMNSWILMYLMGVGLLLPLVFLMPQLPILSLREPSRLTPVPCRHSQLFLKSLLALQVRPGHILPIFHFRIGISHFSKTSGSFYWASRAHNLGGQRAHCSWGVSA